MLAIQLLLSFAGFLSVHAQSKVPPPPNRGVDNYPAFYIYKDVDQIARAGGKLDVCSSVKAIRSTCYNLGIKQNSYAAEQECLCGQQAALVITQCYAEQYQVANSTVKAALKESFLYYTYDCYCGVRERDPSYDTSVEPVKPFIVGYTGDAILPPVGGCPTKGVPENHCPNPPPCNACEVPQPPIITRPSCPGDGERCGGVCVPPCIVLKPCPIPKVYDSNGQCVCPYGLDPVGEDGCAVIDCGENEEYIIRPGGASCECKGGYEWNEESGMCEETCPVGQYRPAPGSPCRERCPSPEIPDWSGVCTCPFTLGYEIRDGICQKLSCEPPTLLSPYTRYCYCPDPYYWATTGELAGQCVLPTCSDIFDAACYPGLPPFDNSTLIITSSAPPFSSFSDLATLVGPSTIASAEPSEAASEMPITDGPTSTNDAIAPVSTEASAQPTDGSSETTTEEGQSPEETPTDRPAPPVEETPTDRPAPPVEGTPTDEPPAEQTPIAEEPAEQPPVEEEPVQETPSNTNTGGTSPEEAQPSARRRLRWARNLLLA